MLDGPLDGPGTCCLGRSAGLGDVHKCEGLMRYVHVYYYDVMELIICLTVPPVGIVMG